MIYYITFKIALFVFCSFIFLPMIFFIGRAEYSARVRNGLVSFFDELSSSGCITEEERSELIEILDGG